MNTSGSLGAKLAYITVAAGVAAECACRPGCTQDNSPPRPSAVMAAKALGADLIAVIPEVLVASPKHSALTRPVSNGRRAGAREKTALASKSIVPSPESAPLASHTALFVRCTIGK